MERVVNRYVAQNSIDSPKYRPREAQVKSRAFKTRKGMYGKPVFKKKKGQKHCMHTQIIYMDMKMDT